MARENRTLVAVCIACAAVLLVAQLLAGFVAPSTAGSSTGASLGKAGFAYLGGLRTFAAAVLWNRIEPQFHEYYSGVPITEQSYMVPTMRLVTLLDPQFAQAYYVSSYIVYDKVGPAQGVAIAREGVRNNPEAGQLRANLAQLLFIQNKNANRSEVLEQIKRGLDPAAQWIDDGQRYEGYATMAMILENYGEREVAGQVRDALAAMRAKGIDLGDHDHDNDGKQDH